jgi:tetratricopeptide (TPR) repeat protein
MSQLRVISRTSVMHYKGTTETLPQIGRELGADAVVEGTVFRAGGRVRITAQLIDARTDRHLWAHQYERDLQDVLRLQNVVARDIANEIQVKLTPRERTRLASSRPVNPEAHEAYLKGRYYWNQFTEANVRKSLGFFREAIEKDPNYALGYSGLADYYGVMFGRFDAIPQNEACPKAEAAAVKAVELDDSLAETQRSLAGVRYVCDLDFRGSENGLKRAIEINPSYSEAHRLYAILLALRGKGEQATVEMKRAVENDPLSVDLNFVLGWIYYQTRHYDQAIAQYRKAAEMDPKRPDAIFGIAGVFAQQGRYDLAVRDYRKVIELAGGKPNPGMLFPLAYAYARAGERRKALEILNEMNRMPGVTAMDRAVVYVGLGDKQHALASIEKAYKDREFALADLKSDPVYDPLRSDARFQDIVRRMGL